MSRSRGLVFFVLVLLMSSCRGAPEPLAATAVSSAWPQEASLSITAPLESTQVSGGVSVRIALQLLDHRGVALQGAAVQAELWSPRRELFASLTCADQGGGRYLSEYARLPLRGAGGTWRVIGKAVWAEDRTTKVESTFQASPSISETYRDRYGFWIEYPRVFGLGTGFYNLADSGGLHFEDWVRQDGSGYVILDNYRYGAIGVAFAALEVHWRQATFPTDGAGAIALALSLAKDGLHHQDPTTPLAAATAKRTEFQGRYAWEVVAEGTEAYVARAGAGYVVEWLTFRCPGSGWLWSLVLSTDHEPWMDHLRVMRESFECPPFRG
jgi:hypothetical protein